MPIPQALDIFSANALALLNRHQLLRPLLSKQLLCEAVEGIPLPAEQEQQALQQHLQRHHVKDEDGLKQHLREQGLSEADLRWQVCLPLRIQHFAQEHFAAKAEQRFLERKEQLDQVVYSLLRLKDGFLAQELYLRIAEGEAGFAELAAEHSEGPEKTTHGIVGPVPLRQAHPVLAEALRTSRPGQLLEPFRIEQWWLVARLERYSPASFDDTTRQRMCNELLQAWLEAQVAEALQTMSGNLQANSGPS